MNSVVRITMDRAGSVRAYVQANPGSDPRHQETIARFVERFAAAETLLARERDGQLVKKAAGTDLTLAWKARGSGVVDWKSTVVYERLP